MRRLHERRVDRRKRPAGAPRPVGERQRRRRRATRSTTTRPTSRRSIVKTKQFAVKPMTLEEAALQMELLGHDFFVFRNAESGRAAVMYRRRRRCARRDRGDGLTPVNGLVARGSPPVRVLVVDDHALFRHGLVRGAAHGAETSTSSARPPTGSRRSSRPPSCSPTSSSWTCGCRPSTASRRRAASARRSRRTKIVMLTVSDDEEDLFGAVRAGASGYLLKEVPIEEIAGAVRGGRAAGQCARLAVDDDEAARRSSTSSRAGSKKSTTCAGSPTASSKCCGSSRAACRTRTSRPSWCISQNTVRNHVRNILEKLRVRSRVEAAMYAVREKLVDVGTLTHRAGLTWRAPGRPGAGRR